MANTETKTMTAPSASSEGADPSGSGLLAYGPMGLADWTVSKGSGAVDYEFVPPAGYTLVDFRYHGVDYTGKWLRPSKAPNYASNGGGGTDPGWRNADSGHEFKWKGVGDTPGSLTIRDFNSNIQKYKFVLELKPTAPGGVNIVCDPEIDNEGPAV
jgi:hypothetical protein